MSTGFTVNDTKGHLLSIGDEVILKDNYWSYRFFLARVTAMELGSTVTYTFTYCSTDGWNTIEKNEANVRKAMEFGELEKLDKPERKRKTNRI